MKKITKKLLLREKIEIKQKKNYISQTKKKIQKKKTKKLKTK